MIPTSFRFHVDPDNLLQVIFPIIAAYFEDDCTDELTNEPVLTEILRKEVLASRPTLSRFWNRMDEDTLKQFDIIDQAMRNTVYSVRYPDFILFDLDSTLLNTNGNQEGEAFNYHYQARGHHPLLCFDGLTGDLLKAELRDGRQYCSKESGEIMTPLMKEFREKYPSLGLYLRGDSGFASPELYEACEEHDCKYAIRLKENKKLRKLAASEDEALTRATKDNVVDYAVEYGEFMFRASTWPHSRRAVFMIEKPYGQFVHMYTFVVTTMEMSPDKVIQFYCGRGKMENFIKEAKSGFDFSSVRSHSRIVNANRLRVHMLEYSLFNRFRRLVLCVKMRKLRIDAIRLKLPKIAVRAVHSAGYITVKLCSSCPYKEEFFETLANIRALKPAPLLES